jgi:hypothetical protein
MPEFLLWSAKSFAPENQIALDFFFSHRLPRASPLLPFLSISSWLFEAREEPFQNSSYHLN